MDVHAAGNLAGRGWCAAVPRPGGAAAV